MWEPSAVRAKQALVSGWGAVRARVPILVGLSLLGAFVAIALNVAAPHQARVVLAFPPADATGALSSLGVSGTPAPVPQELTADALLSRMVAEGLTAGPETPASLRNELHVEPGPGPRQVTLTTRGATDEQAVALANGWTTAIIRSRNDIVTGQFQSVRNSLVALRRERVSPVARQELDRRLIQLRGVRSSYTGDAQVLQPAAGVPQDRKHNEVVFAAGGGVLAVVLCLLLEARDPRVRTSAAAAEVFGHPVLGTLSPEAGPAIAAKALAGERTGVVAVTSTAGVRDLPGAVTALAEAFEGSVAEVRVDEPERGLAERVREARRRADVVLVVVPPFSRAPSGVLAGREADGWVVVASLGGTRVEEAQRVRGELEALEQRPVGVVLEA